MSDVLRHKFDTILLFTLILIFAGLSFWKPDFAALEHDAFSAFLALVSRDVIARLKNGAGNGQAKRDGE